jgi:hypothetical protein
VVAVVVVVVVVVVVHIKICENNMVLIVGKRGTEKKREEDSDRRVETRTS